MTVWLLYSTPLGMADRAQQSPDLGILEELAPMPALPRERPTPPPEDTERGFGAPHVCVALVDAAWLGLWSVLGHPASWQYRLLAGVVLIVFTSVVVWGIRSEEFYRIKSQLHYELQVRESRLAAVERETGRLDYILRSIARQPAAFGKRLAARYKTVRDTGEHAIVTIGDEDAA